MSERVGDFDDDADHEAEDIGIVEDGPEGQHIREGAVGQGGKAGDWDRD